MARQKNSIWIQKYHQVSSYVMRIKTHSTVTFTPETKTEPNVTNRCVVVATPHVINGGNSFR